MLIYMGVARHTIVSLMGSSSVLKLGAPGCVVFFLALGMDMSPSNESVKSSYICFGHNKKKSYKFIKRINGTARNKIPQLLYPFLWQEAIFYSILFYSFILQRKHKAVLSPFCQPYHQYHSSELYIVAIVKSVPLQVNSVWIKLKYVSRNF